MSLKAKKKSLPSTYTNKLRSSVKTELETVYLTTDNKKFLNLYKAIIHESELEDERNKNRSWEQMKTNIAELLCEVLKEKQWGIFFKHEPVQALPVQNNTVLYKVNEVKEDELVHEIKKAINNRINERTEEWQGNQTNQNPTSQELSDGTKTTLDNTKE